jgi:hypothetical protein
MIRSRRARAVVAAVVALAMACEGLAVSGAQPSPDASSALVPVELPLLESPPLESLVPSVPAPAAVPSGAAAQSVDPREALLGEVGEARDAFTRVFRDASGGLSIDGYTTPIHYLSQGEWVPISNELSPDAQRPGWVHTTANSWSAAFGPSADGVELSTAVGVLSMRPMASTNAASVRSTAAHAADAAPRDQGELLADEAVPDDGVVEYAEVWPGVSLRYSVRSAGLKEDIILRDSQASARYSFAVKGAALTARPDGGLALAGPLGEMFVVPPPTVADAEGVDLTASSGVHYELVSVSSMEDGTPATEVAVVLDASWLASQPVGEFPLVIDPAFDLVNATANVSIGSPSGSSTTSPISTGRTSSGTVWRAAVRFNQYEPYLTGGYRVYNAQLQFSGKTASDPPLEVYDQGAQSPRRSRRSAPGRHGRTRSGTSRSSR